MPHFFLLHIFSCVSTYWEIIGKDIIGHHDRPGGWFTHQLKRASGGEEGKQRDRSEGEGEESGIGGHDNDAPLDCNANKDVIVALSLFNEKRPGMDRGCCGWDGWGRRMRDLHPLSVITINKSAIVQFLALSHCPVPHPLCGCSH
jgi:hypothetical protein